MSIIGVRGWSIRAIHHAHNSCYQFKVLFSATEKFERHINGAKLKLIGFCFKFCINFHMAVRHYSPHWETLSHFEKKERFKIVISGKTIKKNFLWLTSDSRENSPKPKTRIQRIWFNHF